MKDQRYQHQPWYIKLWRRRWSFVVPYETIKFWLYTKDSLVICYMIARGMCHIGKRMNYVYTTDEVNEMMRKIEE